MAEPLDIGTVTGLSDDEAARRLAAEGLNELPTAKPRSVFMIAFEVVKEPMFLLLVAVGAIYLILGDLQEALMLLSFVFVVMGITFYQERRTERVLEALRDLSSPRALVIRDGRQVRIAGRDVARGDVVVLAEGDRIPADAVIFESSGFSVDESLLTGESVPVRKAPGDPSQAMGAPGGDDLPFVYSGTMVVQGQALAEVKAIGQSTELGKIGKALEAVRPGQTPLQKETGQLVRNLAVFGLALSILVFVVYGLTRGNWLNGVLAGLTLAMAMLPEEFPVVLTIFLALGAWRISRRSVLTRRVPAVETLGSATVLCVDKTGTLTQNIMHVRQLMVGGRLFDTDNDGDRLPDEFHEMFEFSILASQRDPFDPMEKAIKRMGERYLEHTEHLHEDWRLLREYPLSQELLALSHVWESPSGEEYVIAAKGAPEAIADLCHLDEKQARELDADVKRMADAGLRVLGVAKAQFTKAGLPGEQHDFNFRLVGLIGLADPVRPGVPEAIQECYRAGIRVIMITGDYAGTAQYIAHEIGLANPDDVITGQELKVMDDDELRRRIPDVNIFARVVPEQKLRLVNALRSHGQIVAMTGDGVNDAPALKSADIGIAMGARGTDVAREASSLVLLDDAFASIVASVRLGRRIYDNLKKAMAYIFAVHVPIAGLTLLPVLLKMPLVLFPVHIVFMELIIDPACSIVFEAEPEEPDVMTRPPRDPKAPIFGRKVIILSVLQGLSVLTIVMAIYAMTLSRGIGEAEARTLAFTTLIIGNLGLILTNRSWERTIFASIRTKNSALWWVLGGAIVFLALVLYVPFLQKLFHFTTIHAPELAMSLTAGVLGIVWFEILKWVTNRRGRSLARD